MPIAEAIIETDQPARYITQLCQHASHMGPGSHRRHFGRLGHRPRAHGPGETPPEIRQAEWSQTRGAVSLNWGEWTMEAGPGVLTVRAEADDEEDLRRIQELVTARLERFGRRGGLTVAWRTG